MNALKFLFAVLVAVLVFALLLGLINHLTIEGFTDVPQGHWAKDAIKRGVEAGILQGYDNRFYSQQFNGKRLVNRYLMADVAAKLLDKMGYKSTKEVQLPPDVPENHWACGAIRKCLQARMGFGYGGKFHGKRLMNRYQMAVVLANLLNRKKGSEESYKIQSPIAHRGAFIPKDHWAYEAAQVCITEGILGNYGDDKFKGKQLLNRYQLAVILSRLLDSIGE